MEYSLTEVRKLLHYTLENNMFLESRNKLPVSIEIVGESGIGKTSLIDQVAAEKSKQFVKLNLAQMEELGELIGFPIREFERADGSWINEKELEKYENIKLTGETRTSNCAPKWVPKYSEGGGILLLDDYSRAQPRFIQATMELISRGEYAGWRVPKGWTIILTSNPDNGDYLVTGLDTAQQTRFISIKVKFNVKDWAQWAEDNEIDSRCINFVLMHEEAITAKVNARIVTEFFNGISSIEDFSALQGMYLIEMLGSGSVGREFTDLFIMFVNNKLDKIPSPKFMIEEEDEDKVLKKLKSVVGEDGVGYKNSVASIMAQRLVSFSRYQVKSNHNQAKRKNIDRLKFLLKSDIFLSDVKLFLTKELGSMKQFEILMTDREIGKYV